MASESKHNSEGINITKIDKIIHEPARLLILSYLYILESADFLFIMNQTGMTQGNLSSHLSKLETAGYIDIKKDFVKKRPHTMLSLSNKGKTAFNKYKSIMKNFFETFND